MPARPASPRSPRCGPVWPTSGTWPTTASAGWSTWPTGWPSPCWWRDRRGRGRPSWPSRWPSSPGARLIRLQCYEGLDESKALYEWNYRKQLLRIQAGQVTGEARSRRPRAAPAVAWKELEEDIFSEDFLLARPLLEAIRADEPVVLLVDEVDRVELETEALLLEILSEYQVSIPELGTVRATRLPWSS